MNKLTLPLDYPQHAPKAIDYIQDETEARFFGGKKLTIRVGFEQITLPVAKFQDLTRALVAAMDGGGHPDDWASFYEMGNPSTNKEESK